MKKYDVYYRLQGCPNGSIWCKTIDAVDQDDAEMTAYIEVDERYTILSIVEQGVI